MSDDNNKINPQITSVEIGRRNLRKLDIYPLALGDELGLTEEISIAIAKYFDKAVPKDEDSAVIKFALDLIKDNFNKIIGFVVEDEDPNELVKEITNAQFCEIAEIVYKCNFEDASKNAVSLSEMIKKALVSVRQSPLFVKDTDTDLLNSIEKDLAKVESLEES